MSRNFQRPFKTWVPVSADIIGAHSWTSAWRHESWECTSVFFHRLQGAALDAKADEGRWTIVAPTTRMSLFEETPC